MSDFASKADWRGLDAYSRALGRPVVSAWPLVEAAGAGTLAWVVAKHLVGNHEPFFAPIATVVALNQPLGERGLGGARLVLGVFIGIVAGEIAAGTLGSNYLGLGAATLAAMLVAKVAGGARLLVIQAAAAAILTVAAADGAAGADRLVDAVVGVGVALLFTQVLFSPEPLKLLREAEASVLEGLATGLEGVAGAIESGSAAEGAAALARLRDLRDKLSELSRLRRVSLSVVHHSAVWRLQRAPVVQEMENAGHLDLLAGSCVALARRSGLVPADGRTDAARTVRALAASVRALAGGLESEDVRQATVNNVLEALRSLPAAPQPTPDALATALALEMVAVDVMIFAGADATEALAAGRAGASLTVSRRPAAGGIPVFKRWLPWRRRGVRRAA